MKKNILLFILLAGLVKVTQGQNQDAMSLSEDQLDKPLTISLLDDDEEEEKTELKKKKRKKNVFYGVKTRKHFTKSGVGDRAIFETFYYLREYREPDPYIRDIYWFDFDSRRIKVNANVDKRHGVILHGPYEKYRPDGTIIEKGIYYFGTKHGRWTRYDNKNILLDKHKYYKGWPKESQVTYYDQDRTKLKEVIPVEYGVKEGNYFLFHDNGTIAVSGEFQNDEPVNVWREFYKFRRRKKKEVQFKSDAYDENFNTYIIKEWNDKGDLIYDYNEYRKRVN